MKIRNVVLACICMVLIILSEAHADYCAVGEIKGHVCKGFIIESCKNVRVDAVKDNNGKLYTVKKCYSDVSEYSEGQGRCWINTKSKGGGFFSWGSNAATQPEFLHQDEDGDYEEIDAEYLTFKCTVR